MKLSVEDLELLAKRSRLILSEKEREKYRHDLGALEELSSALLEYTHGLTDEEKPQHLGDMRTDCVVTSLDREQWLAAAPARSGDYVPVPCVVGEVEDD